MPSYVIAELVLEKLEGALALRADLGCGVALALSGQRPPAGEVDQRSMEGIIASAARRGATGVTSGT